MITGEKILNPSTGEVFRATDPAILPQPYASPTDFSAQYPTPLNPVEIIAMCDEITLMQNIPEQDTALKQETWRELNSLAFTSGSSYIAFADGECPEEYTHDGDNTTVTLKNYGAKKTLSLSDIKHSSAVAAANWHGINALVGPAAAGEGIPGAADFGTFQREVVADVKEKEIRAGMTLVMNGLDADLVNGNHVSNSLEFSGIENWATNYSCTMHTNNNTASGTFSSTAFDRFLNEGCVTPNQIWGHPQAVQEMMLGYFQLGFQGSEIVNFATGDRIVPGFNFAGFVNTAVGKLAVIADSNFRRNDIGGGNFQADLWPVRTVINGEPLIYRSTQFRLGLNDLAPGCTSVSFQIWSKTALVIKHCCAHGKYTSQFTGRIATTCPTIG